MTANSAPLICAGLLALQPGLGSAEDGQLSLTVNIRGAKPDQGQILCALFSSAENYLKRPLERQTQPVNAKGRAICRFSQLPPGAYAVSAIYDKDRNGELNTGLFGIPTEQIGMSNDAKGSFGPPSFDNAAFSLTESQQIEILLENVDE